ncbi:MAG: hypothetical protein CSYNP_04162 [Syntrophus sp. SKADARSKE-3]|nr:hypothetical protein [Syntrophus sp. SKADARSKE-3]
MRKYLLVVLCLCLSACGYRYTWDDPGRTRMVSNKCFDASIEPSPNYSKGFNSFMLKVANKANSDLTINWNKSFYVRNGATNGGIDYQSRCFTERKEPDTIFPGGTFAKYIYPDVYLVPVFQGCDHDYLPLGKQGIMLTVLCEGKEIRERISVNIKRK